MTQLIINGQTLPNVSRDRYRCYEEVLGVNLEMASGRMVTELRGKVYRIEWSYDYLPSAAKDAILTALRGGNVTVTFLPDVGTEVKTSTFLCTSITEPTLAFIRGGVAYWHNLGFSLREVRSHD